MPSAGSTAATDEERPLGELLSEVTGHLQVLVRKEMELARLETKDQLSRAAKGAGAFGAAGAIGFVGLILLASAAAWGLAEVMATGLAFVIVGAVLVLVAAVVALRGKAQLNRFSPVPDQTLQTVKEDVQTAKSSLQRGVKGPDMTNHSATSGGD
jgi:hypothetical protein